MTENVYTSRPEGPCERHGDIVGTLADHENRLRSVEKVCGDNDLNNKHIFTRLDGIEKAVGGLDRKFTGAAFAIIALLAGFFVWYVQNIGPGIV